MRADHIAAAALAALASLSAQASDEISLWNKSADPVALYGHCGEASSMSSKLDNLRFIGETVNDVLAIKVLNCNGFSSEGVAGKVACPAGSPYDYCFAFSNDGRGNSVKFGVLKAGSRTDPNGLYEGCPNGAALQPKIDLVRPAGKDPRTLTGIVTVSCSAATAARASSAREKSCPGDDHPYSFCISTPNDGHGNAVTLGVLHYRGTGDAYGLYGECDQQIQPGFQSKASVLPLVGKSMQDVRLIDMLSCAVPWGYGDFPPGLHVGACVGNQWVNPAVAPRYDYCIWGTDARNAGIVMGVVGN